MIDILNSSNKTVDALTKLDPPGGVDIEIKVWLKEYISAVLYGQVKIFSEFSFPISCWER